MASKEKAPQYLSLKALFESGAIKKMKDIETLFPTLVSQELGLNHSRYIAKLYKPELFSFAQIMKLALLLEIDPKIISDIILTELASKGKAKKSK